MPLLHPPDEVLAIARRLEENGYETWCVGGAVRDAMLGIAQLDWDLATSATPEQVRDVFGPRRTIPVGIEFGTIGVLDSNRRMHEVTTFRRDVKTDGRHAVVEFGAALEEDLARRDFTINAIAYSPALDELRDPFEGRRDLDRRVVRAVGDARTRMREDRLRALRAIRFSTRFGFSIEASTRLAIDESAATLGGLSRERIKQEIDKTLEQVGAPSRAFAIWRDSGAFASVLPQLSAVADVDLRALDRLATPGLRGRPQRRLTRMAALITPLAPADRMAVMVGLKSSKQETSWAMAVARGADVVHEQLGHRREVTPTTADRDLRSIIGAIGRLNLPAVMRLAVARWAARRGEGEPAPSTGDLRGLYRRMLRISMRDPLDIRDLAVDGDDLRRSGIPVGPELGRILHVLLERVLDDPARNRTDWLLHEAARIVAE